LTLPPPLAPSSRRTTGQQHLVRVFLGEHLLGVDRHLTDLFGWMTPGETKTFALAQLDEAAAWAAG
jgi:hypothetical protein